MNTAVRILCMLPKFHHITDIDEPSMASCSSTDSP